MGVGFLLGMVKFCQMYLILEEMKVGFNKFLRLLVTLNTFDFL